MEHIDFFKKTLIALLEEQPRGAKAKLADTLGINRINLSSYLAGRDNFSEQRKNEIAKYFGFTPEEFLALGMRLFYSDDPWLWALRVIYLDQKRYQELLEGTGFPDNRFKAIFDIGRAIPLMPEEKPKILEATGFSEEDFIEFGRREILKNPKKEWDLGGMTNSVGTSIKIGWKNAKPIESGMTFKHKGAKVVNSTIGISPIIQPSTQENEEPEMPALGRELIDTLKQQVEDHKTEKEELKAEKLELKKEISELKERIRSLEAQISTTAESDVKKSAS